MKLKDAYKDFDLAFVEIYVESNKGSMYNHFIDSDDEDECFHLEDKYPDVEGVISIDLKKGGFVFKGTYQEPERNKKESNSILPERKQNETYRWESFVEFFNGKEWVLENSPVYVKTSKEDRAREKVLDYCSANYKTSKKNFKINSIKIVGVTRKTN